MKKKKLYIIGAGGFGREVLFTITRMNSVFKLWDNIYFIDDWVKKGVIIRDIEVVGNVDFLKSIKENIDVVIAHSDSELRFKLVKDINKDNLNFPNIFDPSAVKDPKISIGRGNIIMINVILSTDLIIGDFNIFNSNTSIGHDTCIGNYNMFFSRNSISGSIKMGNLNVFGLNSSVVQGIVIGNENKIR
ncbi:MAG: serine acetyltransferase [Vicingaceae bacterium]